MEAGSGRTGVALGQGTRLPIFGRYCVGASVGKGTGSPASELEAAEAKCTCAFEKGSTRSSLLLAVAMRFGKSGWMVTFRKETAGKAAL